MKVQEKEKIMGQLMQLQVECVKEYLQDKLYTITTKEVVNDIVQGFIHGNNVQFIQSITENIVEVKTQNKMLKRELEFMKITHSKEFQEVKQTIVEEYRLNNQETFEKQKAELMQQIVYQTSQMTDMKQKQQKLSKEYEQLITELKKEKDAREEVVNMEKEGRQKLTSMKGQNDKLRIQLRNVQHSSLKFKQQCEQLLNQKNQEIQKSSVKSIENLRVERQQFKVMLTQQQQSNKIIETKLRTQISEKKEQLNNQVRNMVAQMSELALSFEQYKTKAIQKHQNLTQSLDELQEVKQRIDSEKESMTQSLKYLQEENQYLRQEIISFRNRYQALNDQKYKVEQQLQSFIESTNSQINLLNISKLDIQQQMKQKLAQCCESYQLKLTQLKLTLQDLQQQKHKLSEAKTIADEENEHLKGQIYNLKEQNKCMNTQLKFHVQQEEVHQKQLTFSAEQMNRINEECRAQLQTFKKTYQLNWNELNQELLEQKYKHKVAKESVNKLTENLSIEKQKQKLYSMYIEQNVHLKKQLDFLTSKGNCLFGDSDYKMGNGKDKFRYYLSKINLQLKDLKQQNQDLKAILLKQVQTYQQTFQQNLVSLIVKVREDALRCSYCQHRKNLIVKPLKQTEHLQLSFQKTLPKSMNQSVSFTSLKKSLKSIQHRYQHLNQQNKFYSEHLDTLIKKV